MIAKRYQNEWIVLAAFLLMAFSFIYKNVQISSQQEMISGTKKTVQELKEVIALQKIWADKKIAQNVTKLQSLVPPSKLTWSSKNKNVTASYSGLTSRELNAVTSKIMTLPVEIKKLAIENKGTTYDLEFQCKW